MIKRGCLLLTAWLLVLGGAAPALGHAERSDSSPKDGARLDTIPSRVVIDFTEPPIADAVFEVLDGCGRDVVSEIAVQNTEIDAALQDGQPGKWTVNTHVVSGIDGHPSKDRWGFTVAGTADCSQPDEDPPEPIGASKPDDGNSFPLLPFLGGTVLLVALALVLRGRSS